MVTPYVAPKFQETSFNCPYCSAFAVQSWLHLYSVIPSNSFFIESAKSYRMSRCTYCGHVALWHQGIMLVPDTTSAPQPHEDMPQGVSSDYEEARSILVRSPRSAAALLRLALQKLCAELGEKGKNINDDIGNLVQKGLPVEVQQALDIIRVVGNEQVHPGELDVRDDPSVAAELFVLINFIIEDRITRPKSIRRLYERLPVNKINAIDKRDSKSEAAKHEVTE